MPLDLDALSSDERAAYQELGQRFSAADAVKQADHTLRALDASWREILPHDFLAADATTLQAARDHLDDLLHGEAPLPVDPDASAILTGLILTLAREADHAGKEATRAAYGKSQNLADVLIAHAFRLVIAPLTAAPIRKGSLREIVAHAAEQDRAAEARRALRRARARAVRAPPAMADDRPAAPYRAAPAGRKAALAPPPPPAPIVPDGPRLTARQDVRRHGRSALKSTVFLALGAGALGLAGKQERDHSSPVHASLGAAGAILFVVSLVTLTGALVRLLAALSRLSAIRRQEP